MKVAAAALNQTPLAWDQNRDNIIQTIVEAKQQGVSILCCPELCITGYGCEDAFLATSTTKLAEQLLLEIVPHTKSIIVSVGLPILYQGSLYNTACLIANGKILGFFAKQHLANTGVHYEHRWFTPWPEGVIATHWIQDQEYPLGDILFEVTSLPLLGNPGLNSLKIGFEICEDAWVPKRTGIELAQRGAEILLNPSASHFSFGKSMLRKRFVLEGARLFNVIYIYANLLGNEAGRLIYDGDTYIAVGSELVAEGNRFSFKDKIITTTTIDLDTFLKKRVKLSLVEPLKVVERSAIASNLSSQHEKNIEFIKAVTLGLFDYLRKAKVSGYVVNLSGGADSSLCTVLVYLMVQLGIKELGEQEFLNKLAYIKWDHKVLEDLKQSSSRVTPIIAQLLFCVYQKTKNNSSYTLRSAIDLTSTLQIPFAEFNIDPLVNEYCDLVQSTLKKPLTWEKNDVALQNIQARSRAPLAWLMANLRNSVLICTSNRSEIAVGYATVDGDTSGGLAPIAGVDKTFIMQCLQWLASQGLPEIGPMPVLKSIVELVPSAELKPPGLAQTDEKDLMPYAILDTIVNLWVRDKRNIQEILQALKKTFPKETQEYLLVCLEKFLSKWSQNQWKRERLAPAFYLDDESIDPKTWCRYPILSGSYEREIQELDKTLKTEQSIL